MRLMMALMVVASLGWSTTVQAGPFRKSGPDPEVHVPALINVLKNDKDEKRRANAANDLGEFDGKNFPDILNALVDAMNNDPSSTVRAEAAESIGNIRPISTKAGYALEQAINNDKSISVRLAARTSLLQYRILGYFGGAKPDATVAQTAEPPIAALTANDPKPSPSNVIIRPAPSTTTAPPSANMPLLTPQVGPREPSNNSSMFPLLNRLNPFSRTPTPQPAPVIAKEKTETAEPPVARPMAPPAKKDFSNLVDEPPVKPKTFVPPVEPAVLPRPVTTLTSDPKPLISIPIPNVVKPVPTPIPSPTKPTEDGPTLGPIPGK